MQPLQRLRDTRSSAIWPAVPVLLLGAWALPTQAPDASQTDLEKRVAELEARLLKGPGTSTRIKAPFEVVDASGTVVLRVAQAKSGTGAVEIYHSGANQAAIAVNAGGKPLAGLGAMGGKAMIFVADNDGPRVILSGEGEVVVIDENDNEVAAMSATKDGGRVAVGTSADSGGVAVLEVDENGGLISISGTDGGEVASLAVDSESGFGSLRIGDDSADVAILGATKDGAGVLSLSNAADKVVVKVSGGLNGAGGVVIGNAQGLSVMDLMVDREGAGMLRLFPGGGTRAVVLGRNANGGLLQLYNSSGVNALNLQIGKDNNGYLQLTDAAGETMVEAGVTAEKRGIVRAGPMVKCAPAKSVMGFTRVPDCIHGRLSQ